MGVAVATDAGLALLTLDDGVGGNRLNLEGLQALTAAFTAAEADRTVRAVLLRSAVPPSVWGWTSPAWRGRCRSGRGDPALFRIIAPYPPLPAAVIALVQGPVKAAGSAWSRLAIW
jgi:enoyl-CoA hydratase/carnithine racemase